MDPNLQNSGMGDEPDDGPSFVESVRGWRMHHFSLTDMKGESQLLRKVADALDELGQIQVFDITFKQEPPDGGQDKSTMTVYFDFAKVED